MGRPLSVVMPARNAAPWIRAAVKSVLVQSFGDFELLIVDDGSEDDTIDIARSFRDPRIRILQPGRIGFVRALNVGFADAVGEFVARMDADDIIHPGRFEAQVRVLRENPSCQFVSCLRAILTPNHYFLLPQPRFGMRWLTTSDITFRPIQFTEGGSVFDRRAALNVGLFDEEFGNETSLYYKLLANGRGAILGKVLYAYRIRVDSHSKTDLLARRHEALAVRQKYDPANAGGSAGTANQTEEREEFTLFSRLVKVCLMAGDLRGARMIAWTVVQDWPLDMFSWQMIFRVLRARWKPKPSVVGWVAVAEPW